jgi:hypothetical protein
MGVILRKPRSRAINAWIIGVSSEGGWHRIDKNGGTITVSGSVNTTTGTHSFFDDKPIYSDMITVSMDSLRPGQSMVKIPKFWYKRIGSGQDGDPYKLWVANKAAEGFAPHPAFALADHFYVGAYTCGGANYDSIAGLSPKVSMTFTAAQSAIPSNHGTGWRMWDIYQLAAIQMLFLVEFGSPDAQTLIGSGHSSGSSAVANGASNAVYRGIHELWANVWQMVDGYKGVSGVANIWALDGSDDWVPTGYSPASGSATAITSVATNNGEGYDLRAVNVYGPTGATAFSDHYWGVDSAFVPCHGGYWGNGAGCGVFTLGLHVGAASSSTGIGVRLAKVGG